ncbi:MAG: hypothetical protein J6Q22_10515 [Prevotella sp.]|nr:hypothetical protein [Prevotella sp.]
MKTKEIIAAVNNLKVVFRSVCDKCKALPLKSPDIIDRLNKDWALKIDDLMISADSDAKLMEEVIDELRKAFQVVCMTCSRVSNDDNPSNHGQTFVSLDSGNCQANSGRAKSTHTDDNVVLSRADWIGMHCAPEIDNKMYGISPDVNLMMKEEPDSFENRAERTSTMLPAEVEDKLRTEFSNFVSLDIIDKLLLSCIMSGMNIAEFAKMLWFPYSIVDPKTRMVKSITKQAAHARWINICKRFPVFMSVAISSSKDKRSLDKLRRFVLNPNSDEPSDKFKNGKLTNAYLKAEKRARDNIEKKKEARLKRLEDEAMALRKANEILKEKLNKTTSKATDTSTDGGQRRGKQRKMKIDSTGILPGF